MRTRTEDLCKKLQAIMRVYERSVNGSDCSTSRKARLESLFAPCEEIALQLSDPEGDFYKKAHLCLDIVSGFMVFHLALLQFAETEFGTLDWRPRKRALLQFYPVLLASYSEQATANYSRSLILNYSNAFDRSAHTEEILNEMNGRAVLRLRNDGFHSIWETSHTQMERDSIFYPFSTGRLYTHKPEFMIQKRDAPVLLRAL